MEAATLWEMWVFCEIQLLSGLDFGSAKSRDEYNGFTSCQKELSHSK